MTGRFRRRVHLARIRSQGRLKLEIGSGQHPTPGYVHLDCDPAAKDVDLVHDLTRPLPLAAESVSEVLANHVLEHVGWREIGAVLGEIRRVLVPGGRLLLRTPDLRFVAERYLAGATTPEEPGDEAAIRARLGTLGPGAWALLKLFSGQDAPGNFHRAVYDFESLAGVLAASGFASIQRERGWPVYSAGELAVSASKPGSAGEVGDPGPFPGDAAWLLLGRLVALRHRAVAGAAALAAAAVWPFRRSLPRAPPAAELRVIAVSLGGRGDLVTALAAIHRQREAPGRPIRLTVVTDSALADVTSWCAGVSEVVAAKLTVGPAAAALPGAGPALFRSHPRLFLGLRERGFDHGLNLGPSAKAAELGDRILELVEPRAAHRIDPDPRRSLPDRVAEAVSALAGAMSPGGRAAPGGGAATLFTATAAVAATADRLLAEAGIAGGGGFVAVHPGARTYVNLRRWPPPAFAAVLDRLRRDFGLGAVVTGGHDDLAAIQEMAEAMAELPLIAAGRASFAVTAEIVRRARLLLTNDTAMLHVGLATATPTYAVFGPSDPSNVLPSSHDVTVFSSRRSCVPCESERRASDAAPCPVSPRFACLADVTPEEVYRRIARDLAPGEPGRA